MDMKQKRTIEHGYLRGYHSEFDRPDSYYENLKETPLTSFAQMAKFKDRNAALFDKRWQAACEVIDVIAKKLGFSEEDLGLHLYGVTLDADTKTATCNLADEMDKFFNKSGDKVKLKKRIDELEKENQLLRDMLRRG